MTFNFLKIAFFLSLSTQFIFCKKKQDITIMKCVDVAYSCVLYYKKNTLVRANDVYIYKNDSLREYQQCLAEGLLSTKFTTEKLDTTEMLFADKMPYFEEDKPFIHLDITQQKDTLIVFKEKYLIERENTDTIFAKAIHKTQANNGYLVVIGFAQ